MIRCISSSKHYNYDKTKHSCHGWTNLNRKMIYKFSFFLWIKMTCTFSYLHTWSSLPSYSSWFHIVSYLYRITHDARKISIYILNNAKRIRFFLKKWCNLFRQCYLLHIHYSFPRIAMQTHIASYFVPLWNVTLIESMFLLNVRHWISIKKE